MTPLLSLIVLMQPPSLQLAPLFTDGCVLQRNVPVRIWGKASPGSLVEVGLDGEERVPAVATSSGDWEIQLPPHDAGGTHELVVNGDHSVKLKNVVFGEVWVCSGQSNMEYQLVNDADAASEIPHSANSMVRMFNVPKATAEEPQETISGGHWLEAGPANSGVFSAVGYYFAKRLQKELGVPIGMIHTSWGGTRIEAWTSRKSNLAQGVAEKEFQSRIAQAKKDPAMKSLYERWKAAGSPEGEFTDPGRMPETAGWESDLSDEGWGKAKAPGEWSTLGLPDLLAIDGGVWFRKKITVPAEWAGKPASLHLGAIDDFDVTFLNGKEVGKTGAESPNWWTISRVYPLRTGVLKAGENLISIRIWDNTQGGGIYGKPEEMFLLGPDGTKIDLAGEWQYRVENSRPEPFNDDPNTASTLYNAMLFPLRKYTVKGAIWYQGEANSWNPSAYRSQLPKMAADWRDSFHNPDLYFFPVQLAPWQNDDSQKTAYALTREAISMIRDRTKNADSVVITDVGNETDIHPKQKGPVGERLALLAANMTYGKHVYAHSPRFKGAHVDGNKIVVDFISVGSGLTIKGGINSLQEVPSDRLVGFQVAGEDKVFVEADAKIVNKDQVEVSNSSVPKPKYVRFGFVNYPRVNLWSKDGLPAEPFRTDPE